MSRVSIELVPRNAEVLLKAFETVRTLVPSIDMINLPDLARMPVRAVQGAAMLRDVGARNVIPHVRACDIAPDAALPGVDQPGITEVLVIAGDPPPNASYKTWPNTSIDIIRRYRREAPHIDVYAAIDPYRSAPREEIESVIAKREAGASGFFTQPIFDVSLLNLWASWLGDEKIFWGVSPVTSDASRDYWEKVNRVVFPHSFRPSFEESVISARRILSRVKTIGANAYIMPLRIDLTNYLSGLRGIFW